MAHFSQQGSDIVGYVQGLPEKKDDDSDPEESDDDSDFPNYGEMKAITSGGSYMTASRPKKCTVILMSLRPPLKRTYLCEGPIHLRDPWWQVSMKVKRKNHTCYILGFPSYQLRTDEFVLKHKLVTQFLTSVSRINNNDDTDPHMEDFLKHIEHHNLEPSLTFENLEPILADYIRHKEADRKNVGRSLNTIWVSSQGRRVGFALHYPKLFKMTSQLLPIHFLALVDKSSDMKQKDLQAMEEATESCPWVFAFRQILKRKYNIMGMEAQLRNWTSSGLIEIVPPLEKDAIYIYHALKFNAKKWGHTYIRETNLRTLDSTYFAKHTVQNWGAALDFLDENEVIVRETEKDHVKVFLHHLWHAEKTTAKAFATILENGNSLRTEWDVDVNSKDFAEIREDADQWKALHLMLSSPIAVLSGKGGCGKTSVVTKLLSHACRRSGPAMPHCMASEENIEDVDLETSSTNCSTTENVAESSSRSPARQAKQGLDMTRALSPADSEAVMKDGNQDQDKAHLSGTVLGEKILLTAPTGKAANLLGQKASLKSCTLHSVIMSYYMTCKHKAKGDPAETKWTHADKEILVVDECSLVSVCTFSSVIKILLKECCIKNIILLGDIRQLPSIEPGEFLRCVFSVFAPMEFGIELRTNHRAESQLIVDNATRISSQAYPVFDSTKRFHLKQPEENDEQARDDLVRSLLNKAWDIQNHTVSQFVAFTRKDNVSINELCCKHYNHHSLRSHKNKWNFQKGDKVCMTRNGVVKHHAKHKVKIPKKTAEDQNLMEPTCHGKVVSTPNQVKRNLFTADQVWEADGLDTKASVSDIEDVGFTRIKLREQDQQAGNALTRHRNTSTLEIGQGDISKETGNPTSGNFEIQNHSGPSTASPVDDASSSSSDDEIDGSTDEKDIVKTDVKLCNGEIFFIEKELTIVDNMNKMKRYLVLCDRDQEYPRKVCVDYKDVMRTCKMRHAWVRTIHTFQGSESEVVVYILSSNCGFENWQHVYTAITRGRKAVYVVGNDMSLQAIIKRPVYPRRTTLDVKLKERLLPVEQVLKECAQRIQRSLKSEEIPLFDSDESWIQDVGEQLNMTEDELPFHQFTETQHKVPIPCDSYFQGKASESDSSVNASPVAAIQVTPQKRPANRQISEGFISPAKSPRLNPVQVTPVRGSLNTLSLTDATEGDS